MAYKDKGCLRPSKIYAFIVLIMIAETAIVVAVVFGIYELISWLVRS